MWASHATYSSRPRNRRIFHNTLLNSRSTTVQDAAAPLSRSTTMSPTLPAPSRDPPISLTTEGRPSISPCPTLVARGPISMSPSPRRGRRRGRWERGCIRSFAVCVRRRRGRIERLANDTTNPDPRRHTIDGYGRNRWPIRRWGTAVAGNPGTNGTAGQSGAESIVANRVSDYHHVITDYGIGGGGRQGGSQAGAGIVGAGGQGLRSAYSGGHGAAGTANLSQVGGFGGGNE